MDENILVDIQVPAVSMRFDASIPLYAPGCGYPASSHRLDLAADGSFAER